MPNTDRFTLDVSDWLTLACCHLDGCQWRGTASDPDTGRRMLGAHFRRAHPYSAANDVDTSVFSRRRK